MNISINLGKKTSDNQNANSNESQWEILVEQIIKCNVIPVIGSGLTKCEGENISDILVRNISAYCNMKTPARSFSQLIPRFQVEHENESIYSFVSDILSDPQNGALTQPTNLLRELLAVKYFPFVIYTSYDPTVEKCMKDIHGEGLRVFSFDNNAETNGDIPPMDNLKTPTLYYILGKANNKRRRFVLSDKDMLDFSRSWLAETDSTCKAKPANLSNALANKFLLVLGCDYTDWLFRFFWFAMKDAKIRQRTSNEQKIGMLAMSESSNEELIDFLTRSNTLTQNVELSEFIHEMIRRVAEKEAQLASGDSQLKFANPQADTDVFISYSRADKELAEQLYDVLTAKGLNVWYDKQDLGAGTEFMKDIRFAVRTTKIFVPLLTHNIKEQAHEEHVYREEWLYAIERKKRLGNVTYICPLCTSDFNIEDRETDIPEELKAHNLRTIPPNAQTSDLETFAEEIKAEVMKLR